MSETTMARMIDWHKPKSLQDAISRCGLTYDSFAAAAGISRSTVIRLIHDRNGPNWATQQKIEKALIRLEQAGAKCDPCKGAQKGYGKSGRPA